MSDLAFERLFSLWQADYLQEASLLMANLCYVEGEYRDALGNPHSVFIVLCNLVSDFRAKGGRSIG